MNNFQLIEKRNKVLERRWKITLVIAVLFLFSRPVAMYLVSKFVDKSVDSRMSNPYPLIDPSRQFIEQKDFVTNIQPLREYLQGLASNTDVGEVSIYYEQLNSGANITVNQDARIFPASLAKLPLALVVAKKIERGEWKWDDKLVVSGPDQDKGSGELYKSSPGTVFTIETLMAELLQHSDNTAYNIFKRNVSNEDRQRLVDEVGLGDLFDGEGKISAKEYSRLFRILYTSSFLERESSTKILQMLADTDFSDYLSQGIPDEYTFAHKYGQNVGHKVALDSGIVYFPNRPYMITVIIQLNDESIESHEAAKKLMKQIAEKTIENAKAQ